MEPLRVLDYHPGALAKRLCIILERHDGRFCVYARQEVAMPDAAQYAALCAEFHAEVMVYLDQIIRQEERQRHIQALWAQIKAMEAAQGEVAR